MSTNSSNLYKLSEFAEIINVSTKTLQRWDKSKLLVADRNDTNRRIYTDNHIELYKQMSEEHSERLSRRKNFKYKDLTGSVFGMLTVIRRDDDFIGGNGHRHIQWLCECECGIQRVIKGSSLSAGYNKSCGCSQYGDGDTQRMWSEYLALNQNDKPLIVTQSSKSVGRQRKDLTGQTFGWLTALNYGSDVIRNNGDKLTTWHCICNCGKTLDVITTRLTQGVDSSCGCMPKEMRSSFKKKSTKGYNTLIDLTNQQFGFWTVVEIAEPKVYPSGGRVVRWLCECTCGIQKIVPSRDLRSGASQSCGCMSSSWLEHYVQKYLLEYNIPHDCQKKYPDLLGTGGKRLSYDFLIYDAYQKPMMFIECQGEQHYRPIKRFGGAKKLLEQQIHDKLKKNYATEVIDIPLNEILYTNMTENDVRMRLREFNL